MKQEWSKNWISSTQPRKQRKYRYNAPLHVRQKFVSTHLSETLRKRYNKRSMPIRKGDEVMIVRGTFRGRRGTVDRVDLSKIKVYIDEVKVKKVDGSEVMKPMDPSNLIITKLNLDDKRRQAIIERSGASVKEEIKGKPITKTGQHKERQKQKITKIKKNIAHKKKTNRTPVKTKIAVKKEKK